MGRIQFGDCQLDPTRHLLHKQGQPVHLTPKAFELLELLLARYPAVVSKNEIMEQLWPGTFVSEANIPNLVAEIRDRIGDTSDQPQYLRTVHRLGYVICAETKGPATPLAPPKILVLIMGGHEYPLREGNNILGRGDGCQVVINSHTVSRHHARVRVGAGIALCSDLGSKNGTYVGGMRVRGIMRLNDGDVIQVGDAKLLFRVCDRNRETQTFAPGVPNNDRTVRRHTRRD
jgi:DNA-binding winged helix-turn-helix (wHTH) protein